MIPNSPLYFRRPVFPATVGLRARRLSFALLALSVRGLTAAADPAPTTPAPAVPNAAMVSPAPIIDKPLPPAVGQEIAEEQPTSQHVWLPGHWRWQEGAYVWIAPHWELPPVPHATWVEPRWEKKENGYVLVDGFWQQSSGAPAPATPAPTPPPQVVVVNEPPPPPTREVIVERPSAAHVWIGGYWVWREGRHVWISGHWELPPRASVVWVEPHWERRGNGYVLIEGYWREVGPPARTEYRHGEEIVVRAPQSEVVVIREGPPAPRREVQGPRPSPYHVWIAGYWAWHGGRNVWMAGHWEQPPRGHSTWIEPRWERREGGYIFIEGSWR